MIKEKNSVESYAVLKKSAAYANCQLSNLSEEKKEVIEVACNQIESGDYDEWSESDD